MEPSPQSSHTSHPQDSHGTHQISCTNCRKRKIKCNRVEPCGPCERAGVECIFRARAPRSQRKGKETQSREAELLERLSRLEGLVRKIDPVAIRDARRGTGEKSLSPPAQEEINFSESPVPLAAEVPTDVPADEMSVDMDGMFYDFVKKQEHWSRNTNGTFWKNLSEEINGLRQILEESTDDKEDEDYLTESTTPKHSPPYFLFGEMDPHNIANEVPYPSDPHREILFYYYFENIDPIYKILHRPTAQRVLTSIDDLADKSSHRYKYGALEAATFSMYFATVASLTPDQCMQHFDERKDVLLERYKRGAEMALLRGDFFNSRNVVYLHAFVIYIIGLRASQVSTSSWTLIGIAIRIAQSLGIHRDGDGLHLNAHEAEVRRRIWWHIFSLDMRASEDRGCEPMLSECCFNTRLPLNMEDEDFSKSSVHPLKERKGITQITCSLMNMEVAKATLKLHFVPPKHTTPFLTFQERDDLANECIRKIDSYFVDNYDPTDLRHQIVWKLSRIHVLRLRLVVLYPMQRMSTALLETEPRTRALKYVVELLSIADSLQTNEFVKRFSWHAGTSISWHPIAVALAELCTEPTGPLADEAWRVIDKHWAKWSSRIPSSQEEKIWRPVKSLMKRAREARQRSQPQSQQFQALSLSENIAARRSSLAEKNGLIGYNSPATTFNNVPLSFPSQASGMFDSYQWDFNSGAYPGMDMTAGATIPMNWDDWNTFIYDAGNLDPINYSDEFASPIE